MAGLAGRLVHGAGLLPPLDQALDRPVADLDLHVVDRGPVRQREDIDRLDLPVVGILEGLDHLDLRHVAGDLGDDVRVLQRALLDRSARRQDAQLATGGGGLSGARRQGGHEEKGEDETRLTDSLFHDGTSDEFTGPPHSIYGDWTQSAVRSSRQDEMARHPRRSGRGIRTAD